MGQIKNIKLHIVTDIKIMEKLPNEVLQRILRYCNMSDVLSLACCSKDHHTLMKPRMWQCVNISVSELPTKLGPHFESLKHTTQLYITEDFTYWEEMEYGSDEEESADPDKVISALRQGVDVAFILTELITYCNPSKIVFLDTNMHGACLKFILNTFRRVKTLSLTIESEKYDNTGFDSLEELQDLELRIPCSITADEFRHIVAGKELRRLKVYDTGKFSDDALLTISKLTTLEHLCLGQHYQLSHEELSGVDIRPISRLTNLTVLSLSWFVLADDVFQLLCQCLTKLETLNVSNSYCTDNGLSSAHCLTSLTQLDLRSCQGITARCLLHLVSLPLQKISFYANICKVQGATVENSHVSGLNEILTLKEVFVSAVSTVSGRNSLAVINNSLCISETWKVKFQNYGSIIQSTFTR